MEASRPEISSSPHRSRLACCPGPTVQPCGRAASATPRCCLRPASPRGRSTRGGIQHLADALPGTPSGFRMMSDRGAVLEERHVLRRQDLRYDTLVARLGRARRRRRSPFSCDTVMTPAAARRPPRGRRRGHRSRCRSCLTLSDVSRTSRAFSPKIARLLPQALARSRPWVSPCPPRMSPGTLRADADDAVLAEHLVGRLRGCPGGPAWCRGRRPRAPRCGSR